METKTWSALTKEKIEKVIEIRSRFGWEVVGQTSSSVSMKREKRKGIRQLQSLEKQYNYLSRKCPVGGIVWLSIGLILLIPAIILKTWTLNFLITVPCALALIIGFFLILSFFISKPYSKKMIQNIFAEADELAGKSKQYPISINLKQGDIHSYVIKKAMYKHQIDID